MAHQTTKKTFSIPHYIAERLDELSMHTGVSQSNLVYQALTRYLHVYEQVGTVEHWIEHHGRTSGGSELIE